MTTDYKITELFYIIDEFCKHFDAENLFEDNSGVKRRHRQASFLYPYHYSTLRTHPFLLLLAFYPNRFVTYRHFHF